MDINTHRQIILKKASTTRRMADLSDLPVDKALERALSTTARDLWGLVLDVASVSQNVLLQDECGDVLGTDRLFLSLKGQHGGLGFASIDADLHSAIVESQTIGQVTGAPPEKRGFTSIDAMLAAPFVDGVMTRLSMALARPEASSDFCGFGVGERLENGRAARLLMGAVAYRQVNATVELASGLRKGVLTLLVPTEPPHQPVEEDKPVHLSDDMLMELNVCFDAVLCKLKMPLQQLHELSVGDRLPLPKNVEQTVELMARDRSGFGSGQLGRLDGQRAFRIDEDSPLIAHLKEEEADDAEIAQVGAVPEKQALPAE